MAEIARSGQRYPAENGEIRMRPVDELTIRQPGIATTVNLEFST